MAAGRYPEAEAAITNALTRSYPSPHLRWLAREVFLANGNKERADDMLARIVQSLASGRVDSAASLAALGRAALVVGLDPKLVLERMYYPARKADPKAREVYLAIGDLALDKHDYALAAKTFQEGLKQVPDDPDLLHGLALAYEPSERTLMAESLENALEHNSNHVASLLLLADHAIDAEAYTQANELLDRALQVNPWAPDAWAYRMVIATIQNQPEQAGTARKNALKYWPTNPRVPHLVGLKLSQHYRFREGAALQREALQYDPGYLPAQAQLAQDLLRLGKEQEGWQLADAVQKADNYHVTANNLMSLHDAMAQFEVLTNEHFVLRMSPHEAALYGPRALELLTQAREQLTTKYGCQLPEQTLVEVFTNQADFAVRTFAMPQNDGYLGVCFGDVITANSPGAYPGHPFNWEAMLWHEFCHVITLNLTHNKMPRWLSEGISVYEERQANPAWGERLTPRYREMILDDELTPVGRLSAAFMMPPSGEHLQFAYYQSSLVVEFIIERFGLTNLQAILLDLGRGTEINQALAKHTIEMAALEKEFKTYARTVAESMGPGLDWEHPELGERRSEARGRITLEPPPAGGGSPSPVTAGFDWETWSKAHPTNYYALRGLAQELADREDWPAAKAKLERLIELCPEALGAYSLLAEAHQALGETNAEQRVLTVLAERDDKNPDAYLRLMQLSAAAKDWTTTELNARRYLAVNPLVPVPYRFLAEAAEQSGDWPTAINACRALLQLDPPNPAEVNYRLARLLQKVGDPAARRHVLQALEEAPRYRDALKLLLELNEEKETERSPSAS